MRIVGDIMWCPRSPKPTMPRRAGMPILRPNAWRTEFLPWILIKSNSPARSVINPYGQFRGSMGRFLSPFHQHDRGEGMLQSSSLMFSSFAATVPPHLSAAPAFGCGARCERRDLAVGGALSRDRLDPMRACFAWEFAFQRSALGSQVNVSRDQSRRFHSQGSV